MGSPAQPLLIPAGKSGDPSPGDSSDIQARQLGKWWELEIKGPTEAGEMEVRQQRTDWPVLGGRE